MLRLNIKKKDFESFFIHAGTIYMILPYNLFVWSKNIY
jgi:hypothetical protein